MNDSKVLLLNSNNGNSFPFSKHFRNDFLDTLKNPILLNQPILMTDLLFQIILDFKEKMFITENRFAFGSKENNQIKMDFWKDNVIDNDTNEIKIVYRTSSFLKNRDKELMTNVLEFLKNYKNEKYSFINSKGIKISTSGGLIKDWYFQDNSGLFVIKISLFWANKIVSLEHGFYNILKLNVTKSFKKSNHRFFILYLLGLKLNHQTKKKWRDINHAFGLNYKSLYELKRGFLTSIKGKLDNNLVNPNWFSFNFFSDPNNEDNVILYTFLHKPKPNTLIDLNQKIHSEYKNIGSEKYKKRYISYRLGYYKRQHRLTEENCLILKQTFLETNIDLFEKNYNLFKKDIRKLKMKTTDFEKNDFLEKIKSYYKF